MIDQWKWQDDYDNDVAQGREKDWIIGPSHKKFDRKLYFDFSKKLCKEDKELWLESLEKYDELHPEKADPLETTEEELDEPEKEQQKLNLLEQSRIIANKFYWEVQRKNQVTIKILRIFDSQDPKFLDRDIIQLLELPLLQEWYNNQSPHVRSCYRYWRKAIFNSIKKGRDKFREKTIKQNLRNFVESQKKSIPQETPQ